MTTNANSFRHFAATALLPRLEHLWKEADGVRTAEDIEPVHKMRVASRRLRTALDLMEPALHDKALPRWEKQVKRITRALGAARDADVQILFLENFVAAHENPELAPGLSRLLLRMRQERHELQGRVLDALDTFEESGTPEDMHQSLQALETQTAHDTATPPELLEYAAKQIGRRLQELLDFDSFAARPECKAEHHRMRIAAKHLRYALETFAPLYDDEMKTPIEAVKHIQDLLGQVHDCDVWISQLPAFIEEEQARAEKFFGHDHGSEQLEPGIRFLKEDRARERDERYHEFYDYWQVLMQDGLWERLRQAASPAAVHSTGASS